MKEDVTQKNEKLDEENESVLEDEKIENINQENEMNNEENSNDTEKNSEDDNSKKALEYLDKYQRTLAEFDNFRKRTIKEKASMYNDGLCDAVEKILPVIDNFERALETASDSDTNSALFKGLEMVYKQFKESLNSLGIEEIEAKGKTFDPHFHNAVMHVEDENFSENEIISVLQKGYKCKDKIIRPSMVQVAN